MPAAERQLVECAQRVLGNTEPWRVGVISVDKHSDFNFEEILGKSTIVTTWIGFDSLDTSNDLDVLFVNQSLQKQIDGNGNLDEFINIALKLVRLNGVCIVRQDLSSFDDPKKVAQITDYFDVFRSEVQNEKFGFTLYAVNLVDDSIHAHQNWKDFIWTLVKTSFPKSPEGEASFLTFREFLDKSQYTGMNILAYERIFGEDFISPGGREENLAILKRFGSIKTGQKMLDIGVGIGGGARQAASEFGLYVMGVDLSSNAFSIALDRHNMNKDSRVTYAICNASEYDFEPNSFDLVFSRDCIQHIEDTQKLLLRIYRTLRPGGKVLMTTYGVGYGKLSESFKKYVGSRQYYLKNCDSFRRMAVEIGFTNVIVDDITSKFKEILEEEKRRVERNKQEFIAKFSQTEYESLMSGWNAKLQYIADDNQTWILFMAHKPQ